MEINSSLKPMMPFVSEGNHKPSSLMNSKRPLIVLTGPTAVGKTQLSLRLAKAVNGEIISADSMQVYRYMDIGTAKISENERQGVPHFLIDCLSPNEPFSVAVFQQMAKAAMEDIYHRGHIPILVGGTGFYIQSVLYDIDFTSEQEDSTYRQQLERMAEDGKAGELYEQLQKVDPESAQCIHANNIKRVIRALEYYHFHQRPISNHNREQKQRESEFQSAYFVLNRERSELYNRIDKRVDQMFNEGLENEVRNLISAGYDQCSVAMQGLGYKQLLMYFRGEISKEEAISRIKQETRHFAKRQLTWFRREKEPIWFDLTSSSENDILSRMLEILKQKEIIHAE